MPSLACLAHEQKLSAPEGKQQSHAAHSQGLCRSKSIVSVAEGITKKAVVNHESIT